MSDSGTWDRGLIRFQGGQSPVFAGTIKTVETGALGSFQMIFQGLGSTRGHTIRLLAGEKA